MIFSILAVIIACLGLFGLSAFIAERRTKEVGIRKVFGSSLGEVVFLLVGQFLKWVFIANVLAWPVAWLIMGKWLENFAYHTHITIGTILLSMLLALLIALLTVSYQAIRAARINPVESLRYE